MDFTGRVILKNEKFQLAIERLCYQLIENHDTFKNTCIIGIQSGGVYVAERLLAQLELINPKLEINFGKLDITFFRDDFRTRNKPITAYETHLDFPIDEKNVILVDDVLYTGRTISAALNGLQNYGRPKKIELLTFVDRRFNRHLPIKPDYTGIVIDALDEAFVKVDWKKYHGQDRILLFGNK